LVAGENNERSLPQKLQVLGEAIDSHGPAIEASLQLFEKCTSGTEKCGNSHATVAHAAILKHARTALKHFDCAARPVHPTIQATEFPEVFFQSQLRSLCDCLGYSRDEWDRLEAQVNREAIEADKAGTQAELTLAEKISKELAEKYVPLQPKRDRGGPRKYDPGEWMPLYKRWQVEHNRTGVSQSVWAAINGRDVKLVKNAFHAMRSRESAARLRE
jgi:hypothetical protein